jgi:hypothetical protein
MSIEELAGYPGMEGEFKANRWGRPVRTNAIPRQHLRDVQEKVADEPAVRHVPWASRPRVTHAFGKGWSTVARYLPEPNRPVRVKCRNRGLGTYALVVLERGYQWRGETGTLEPREVTHWRYPKTVNGSYRLNRI